jgi:outer membrane beta-barrel protein
MVYNPTNCNFKRFYRSRDNEVGMTKRRTAILCWLLVLALSGAPETPTTDADGLPPEPPAPPPPTDDLLAPKESDVAPTTPVLTTGPQKGEGKDTWKDIVVIPRKSFLKRRRIELMPYFSTTMNDNLIQHYALGGEINYFLTDILAIGISGHYYFKNVLDQEFYTRYHFQRVPSLNKYKYTATLNFSYVPIYGKFSLFNNQIMHFEVFATAGVGGSGTEIIPRDYRFEAFSNPFTLTFPVGMGGRLFITKWMAVQAAFRSYVMLDKFEPSNRSEPDPGSGRSEVDIAKENAKTDIVNNMMVNFGVSFFFPMDFKYTTFR